MKSITVKRDELRDVMEKYERPYKLTSKKEMVVICNHKKNIETNVQKVFSNQS
jgi:hypothetical protein